MSCSKGISAKDAIDMACTIAARKDKIYNLMKRTYFNQFYIIINLEGR